MTRQPGARAIAASIVICARNAAATLDRQLVAVTGEIARFHASTGARVEVILVDNGSTDGTGAIIEHWSRRSDDMRSLQVAQPGLNRARNAGVRSASSARILMCDADDEVLPGWLPAMVAALSHDALVGCGVVPVTPEGAPASGVRQPWESDVLWTLKSPWGCACGFSVDAWRAVGGFAEHLPQGGEEEDFFMRAQVEGHSLGWVKRPLVRYYFDQSPIKMLRRQLDRATCQSHTYWYGRVRGWPRRPLLLRSAAVLVLRLPRAACDVAYRLRWWMGCRQLAARAVAAVRFAPAMSVRLQCRRARAVAGRFPSAAAAIARLRWIPSALRKWRRDARVLPLRVPQHLLDFLRIHLRFRQRIGRFPEIVVPDTINDLVQRNKLLDRRDVLPMLADKLRVREYVASRLGPGYTVPLLAVASSVDALDVETLPPRFVLKTNHDCGSVFVVRGHAGTLAPTVRRAVTRALGRAYGRDAGEWAYRHLTRRVFAEQLIETPDGEIPDDYKFHCFHGRIYVCQRIRRRGVQREVIRLARNGLVLPPGVDDGTAAGLPEPDVWAELCRVAEVLSAGHPYLRVDLYAVAGTIYVGELTVYPASGWGAGTTHNAGGIAALAFLPSA